MKSRCATFCFLLLLAPFARTAETTTAPDWQMALPGKEYQFPADHAVHPDYKTEWWYFTGNVRDDATGRNYGYELTFFRQGVVPLSQLAAAGERSRFIQSDFKFAHFAISDLDGGKFYYTQKITRGAFGEAGFGPAPDGSEQAEKRLAWIDDWSLQPQPDGTWQIIAQAREPVPMSLNLRLKMLKPPVIEGTDGVSQKATGAGNASHYYSFTRLETTGSISVNGTTVQARGESWFDHEWASNSLSADQIGWNWFCCQFDDHTELMLYGMRKRDGSIDAISSGTFIHPDGRTEHLKFEDFRLRPLKTWRSGQTKAVYPISWQVSIPSKQIEFTIQARMNEQELVLPPISYWEGAVSLTGRRAGQALSGVGYMELTGYAGELGGLRAKPSDTTLPPSTR